MRYLILVFSLILFGCAQAPPETSSTTDWKSFGQETAMKGYVKKSEEKLADLAKAPSVDADLYTAYDQGYEIGRVEYCSQNPRSLGRRGDSYFGICDDIDKWFRFNFERGAESRFDLTN